MRISIGKQVQGERVALSLALAFDLDEPLSDADAVLLVETVRAQVASALDDQVERAAAVLAAVDPARHDAVRTRAVERVREAEAAKAAEAAEEAEAPTRRRARP